MNRELATDFETISSKLISLNIEVSKPIVPIANYVQVKCSGNTLYVSGQLPIVNSECAYKGKVQNTTESIENAKKAAELCVINILKQLIVALDDDLTKIKSCTKLEIFVACNENFERHSEVANGASDFLIKILGERGRHVRVAIGVCSLPLNASIEVTAIFEKTDSN